MRTASRVLFVLPCFLAAPLLGDEEGSSEALEAAREAEESAREAVQEAEEVAREAVQEAEEVAREAAQEAEEVAREAALEAPVLYPGGLSAGSHTFGPIGAGRGPI